jgi:O6-methylguanine-DNA--protein-cysteine methyltransferase
VIYGVLTTPLRGQLQLGAEMARDRKSQLSVAFNDETKAQLEQAAAKSGNSIAEEIRARVEASLEAERRYDAETRRLADDVRDLAADVNLALKSKWHKDAATRAALVMAITVWLTEIPIGGPIHYDDKAAQQIGRDPRTVGSAVAFLHYGVTHRQIEGASHEQTT